MFNSETLFNMKQFIVAVVSVAVIVCCGVIAHPLYKFNVINIPLTYSSLFRPATEWILADEDYSIDNKMNSELVTQEDFDAKRDVIFQLYTTSSLKNPEIIQSNNLTSLVKSLWNPSNPTRILIHGMNSSSEIFPIVKLKESYLVVGEFNVVTVDWSKGANLNIETESVRLLLNGQLVSVFLARFIDWLNLNGFLEFYQVSIVGSSVGSHIAGITGKHVTRGKINTIVGLDPALGPYENVKLDERLTHTDAEYVEIIHTNSGGMGFAIPIGTADFYVNGGSFQPGCGSKLFNFCAHVFSYTIMAESINPIIKKFTSIQCGSYDEIVNNNCTSTGATMVNMGGEPSNHDIARGIYYLTTNIVSPFARGLSSEF